MPLPELNSAKNNGLAAVRTGSEGTEPAVQPLTQAGADGGAAQLEAGALTEGVAVQGGTLPAEARLRAGTYKGRAHCRRVERQISR